MSEKCTLTRERQRQRREEREWKVNVASSWHRSQPHSSKDASHPYSISSHHIFFFFFLWPASDSQPFSIQLICKERVQRRWLITKNARRRRPSILAAHKKNQEEGPRREYILNNHCIREAADLLSAESYFLFHLHCFLASRLIFSLLLLLHSLFPCTVYTLYASPSSLCLIDTQMITRTNNWSPMQLRPPHERTLALAMARVLLTALESSKVSAKAEAGLSELGAIRPRQRVLGQRDMCTQQLAVQLHSNALQYQRKAARQK